MVIIQEKEGKAEKPKKKNSCLWKKDIMILEKPSTKRLNTNPNRAEKKDFKNKMLDVNTDNMCVQYRIINNQG